MTAEKNAREFGITVVANSFYDEHPAVVRELYAYLRDASVQVKKTRPRT